MNEVLARLRKQHKKTQNELANSLGLPRSTYAQYETGKRIPDYVTIKKIASFFNVSTDYLLNESNEQNIELIDLFNNPDVELHIDGVPLNDLQRFLLRDMISIYGKAVSNNYTK